MKAYIFDGQSLGVGSTGGWLAQYGPRFVTLAHPGSPYQVCNIGGTRYDEREPSEPNRVDHWFKAYPHNVLIDDGGSSDLGAADDVGITAEQLLPIKRAYCARRRAAGAQEIVGVTLTPGINQPDTEFWYEAEELAQILRYNDFIRDDPASAGYDRVVDVASIPELQDPSNVAYFYDGVHWTQAAALLAAQKFVEAGI